MKYFLLLVICQCLGIAFLSAQSFIPKAEQHKAIVVLIDQYSQARENRDSQLLKKILTLDVDQLVSTGEWRTGIASAVEGMLKSSATSPGTRTLRVEKIKMLDSHQAIVDCRYEIRETDGSLRKMWSCFIVVTENKQWKISAIRNMLPTGK